MEYHFSDGGTAVTNFDIDSLPKYEAAIEVYGKAGLYIGDPFGPLCRSKVKVLALHINKTVHPFHLSAFWRIYETIDYHPAYHSKFNAYQIRRNGFCRIN